MKLYEHENYGGRLFEVQAQNANLWNDGFNDIASSAKVFGTCCWLFYEHHQFLGSSSIVDPGNYLSTFSWGQSDNQLTSLRALPPSGTRAIALFEYDNYEGRMLLLRESHSNFVDLRFDNIASSAIVLGGNWRIYEHHYYGRSTTFGPGHYPAFYSYSIGHDTASSIQKL